jgi:hypothetical protein
LALSKFSIDQYIFQTKHGIIANLLPNDLPHQEVADAFVYIHGDR